MAVIVAIFSYFSIEMVAIAAAEAEHPQTAVVRAVKATLARLAIFYFATLALMLAISPWPAAGTGESPFVTVIRVLHIGGAASLVNFVVLVAALAYTLNPDTAFTVMISISMSGAMVTWLMIFLTHIAFQRQDGAALGPFRMWGAPGSSYLGAALMAAVLLTTLFTPAFRLTLIVGAPFFALVAAAYFLHFRKAQQRARST